MRRAWEVRSCVPRPSHRAPGVPPAAWLERLTVREGRRIRHRFWQPGGGYDRNVIQASTLRSMIEYIHPNPVRRGLVAHAEDWEWSSARWFLGRRPVPIEMDAMILDELARDGVAKVLQST